jgi:hypothetical protein
MQLTMEPLDEMVASARAMDEAGMDTIWLAEAYPWWRKHGMEARSSTVSSAVIARETKRLTIGWPLHPRLRDVEDLSQQRVDPDEQNTRTDARRGRDRPRRSRRRTV